MASSNDLFAKIQANNANKGAAGKPAPTHFELMEAMIGKAIKPAAQTAIEQYAAANALVRDDSGGLRFDDVQLTSVGLVIPADGISQDTATHLLDMLLRLEGSIQWLIGDVLAYGERVYGETYQEMAVTFGRDYSTLRDYAWVARNVNLSLRNDKLSFNHYRMLAGMSEIGQTLWRDYGVELGWSIAKMRAFLGLLDVYDVEGQRAWLEVVHAEGLTADALRARLAAAGGSTALAVIENDRDLVHRMTVTKRLVNTVEKYGPDLVGCSADTIRDVVKSAREMQRLAAEILEKHGG